MTSLPMTRSFSKSPTERWYSSFTCLKREKKKGWWKLIKPKILSYLKKERDDFENAYNAVDENMEKELSRHLKEKKGGLW